MEIRFSQDVFQFCLNLLPTGTCLHRLLLYSYKFLKRKRTAVMHFEPVINTLNYCPIVPAFTGKIYGDDFNLFVHVKPFISNFVLTFKISFAYTLVVAVHDIV